ncbi:hypothetical protein EZS27_029583 [termite gut metagenome]|uniref:Uncharacterized protein n=1 Tax=termite gut metagenome TaxID=433724 RepID=A0A5J4QJI5_9ZZZZ
MVSLFDFSRHIAELKKGKKYTEALSYFKENRASFSNERLANNEYIISDIISCLRCTNQFDAGCQFLKIYHINIEAEHKERILIAYDWLLWSKYKTENGSIENSDDDNQFLDEDKDEFQEENFNYDKSDLIERIEIFIPILLQIDNDFAKTLTSNLFSVILKTEKKKPAPNWKLIPTRYQIADLIQLKSVMDFSVSLSRALITFTSLLSTSPRL